MYATKYIIMDIIPIIPKIHRIKLERMKISKGDVDVTAEIVDIIKINIPIISKLIMISKTNNASNQSLVLL